MGDIVHETENVSGRNSSMMIEKVTLRVLQDLEFVIEIE